MRALLYDIHGNLPALEAVLADAEDADGFLLGGDYATAGAWPRETVERLRELPNATWIRGNADRWLVDRHDAPAPIDSIAERTAELLGEELVAELAALPESVAIDGTLYCHASPQSDMASFFPEPGEQDSDLLRGVEAERVVFGHTHLAFKQGGARRHRARESGKRRDALGWRSPRVLRRHRSGRRRAQAGRVRLAGIGRRRQGARRRAAREAHGACAVPGGLSARLPRVRLANALAPRDRHFFDLFEEAGGNILRAAGLLEELLNEYPERNELAREILICEQEGDRITHDIIQRLNQTFVTPIDREDIYELASALDDVVDFTEEVADYLGLYKIEAPMEQAQDLARVLHAAARQIAEAMPRLRGFRDISHYTVELNRLENDGDRIVREAIASLFDTGIDPMVVIRWKDIFERLEEAIDATEHVANILQGVVIKNS